jgi:hypothetical protein
VDQGVHPTLRLLRYIRDHRCRSRFRQINVNEYRVPRLNHQRNRIASHPNSHATLGGSNSIRVRCLEKRDLGARRKCFYTRKNSDGPALLGLGPIAPNPHRLPWFQSYFSVSHCGLKQLYWLVP